MNLLFRFPILLAVGALGLAASGCHSRHTGKPRLGEVERLPRLETILPEYHANLQIRRSYTATIEPLEKAELCAQVRGQVKPIAPHVDIGRVVKKNDPLIELDIPDLLADRENKKALLEQAINSAAQAQQAIVVAAEEVKEALAQEKRFQAEVEFREAQFHRVLALAKTETVTRQLVEESQLQLSAAKAALSAAQAQAQTKKARYHAAQVEEKVAQSKVKVARAEVDRLNALVEYATVRAPFDGVITKRWVDTGAAVKDSSMPLLTLMRTDRVRILIDVPERDVPYITMDGMPSPKSKGNPVEIVIPALQDSAGPRDFRGTVTLIASALDPSTRTMRVEVHLDNLEGYLKPQMTGVATVLLAERPAMTVPASALVRSGNKVEIHYIADLTGDPPRGIVKRLEVQLGLDDGSRVEIKSERLTGKELVITKGAGTVRLGDQAMPVPAKISNGQH